MKKAFSRFGIFALIILSSFNLVAQDIECNFENLQNTLTQIQEMQQDEEFDQVTELLNTAISEVESLVQNCSLEPLPIVSPTQTPSDDNNDLTTSKGDGFYLVGIDIMPGRWESTSTRDGCYWAKYDRDNELLGNHFGVGGGTVTVLEDDFQVEFDGCGEFEYVEGVVPQLASDAYEPKESGFYTVGIEIAPGLWRSTGTGNSCYYAKLDEFQDINDNHFGNSGVTINIFESDYEVEFTDCGTWEYLGE